METNDPLISLMSMIQAEERHCFNAIHWQPTSVLATFNGEDVMALDFLSKPRPAEISSMMCSPFKIAWDAAFIACPEYRDRLRQLESDRWVMLSRTAEFLRTQNMEALRQAGEAAAAVGLLVYQITHEHELLQIESKVPPAPLRDGPFGIDGFRWKDVEYRGLTPHQWHFLEHLWTSRNRVSSFVRFAGPVWGSENDTHLCSEDAFGSLRKNIHPFFTRNGIALHIKVFGVQEKVALLDGSPTATVKKTSRAKKPASRPRQARD